MRTLFGFTLAAMLVAHAAGSDAHLGFDIADTTEGYPEIVRVYPGTHAEQLRIQPGGRLMSLAGAAVKENETLAKKLASKKPGEKIAIRIQWGDSRNSAVLTLASAKEIAERAAADEAAEAKKRKAAEAGDAYFAAIKDAQEKHGLVIAHGGAIRENAIGRPEIDVRVCNASDFEIDAVEIRVAMFDKFGKPVASAFGKSHDRKALYQDAIPPRSIVDMTLPVPFHETVGVAEISVTRYLPIGGEAVEAPEPLVVKVRR